MAENNKDLEQNGISIANSSIADSNVRLSVVGSRSLTGSFNVDAAFAYIKLKPILHLLNAYRQ